MLLTLSIAALIQLLYAPLGCIVLWRKYIYFGDGLAHASVLFAVCSAIIGIPILYSSIGGGVIFAVLVFVAQRWLVMYSGAIISLLASIMISISLLLNYIFTDVVNFEHLLFGNILLANSTDLAALIWLVLISYLYLGTCFQKLLVMTISKDIAKIRYKSIELIELSFLVMLSICLIYTLKIIGALLLISMLLIPALCAQIIAKSPQQMMVFSIILGQIINLVTISIAYYFDLPLAPIMVLVGATLLIITKIIKSLIAQ